ncbi:hypothetical protein Tco_1177178 [Tanacetum coccineum]
MDAKFGSVDGGFVASVFGGGVSVDCCGRGVKDGNDCGMTVEYTCEESEITDTLITQYLVNISKRRAFWSLNEDILKINYSDYQYAVSIKEDTAYPCLHSQKDHKGNKLNTPFPKKTNTLYWIYSM